MTPPSSQNPLSMVESRLISFNTDQVLLGLRLTAAALFAFSGATKAVWFEDALAEFSELNLGAFPLIATIVVQCTGAFLLASGVQLRVAALVLALFTFAATLLAHTPWPFAESFDIRQTTVFLEHLVIIAGLMTLAVMGSGRFTFPLPSLRS